MKLIQGIENILILNYCYMKLFFQILFFYTSRFIVWCIFLFVAVSLIMMPIVNWIPVVSHLFVWFYIILIFLWIIAFWDHMINEFRDKKEENTK